MKKKVLVSKDGAKLQLNNGEYGIAVLPAGKDDKASFVLTNRNRAVRITAKRINNVGVARFAADQGFVPAAENDPNAIRLLDLVDTNTGVDYVTDASYKEVLRLQQAYGGQHCLFVPFDPEKPIRNIQVRVNLGTRCTQISSGISCSVLQGEYIPGDLSYTMDAVLSGGWVVPAGTDITKLPRSTEYGGVVELAMFIMSACGIGTLLDDGTLKPSEGEDVTDKYPRGRMAMKIAGTEDVLFVGIDAVDELQVEYVRDGNVIYKRSGLEGLREQDAVGSIAAVLVRVADMDNNATSRKAA